MISESGHKVVVREMEFEDLIDVFHLGEETFTAHRYPTLYRTWDEYEILERFIGDKECCFVAVEDKIIIGFAIGAIIDKRRKYGYLIWLAVRGDRRNLNIGKKLLDVATKKFIRDGATTMLVDTSKGNEGALNFFRKNGFDSESAHIYLSKKLTGK